MTEADQQKADFEKQELIRVNKELQEAKRRLEQSNHFKMHLLTLTSHQFKTPLSVIRGYTTLLREGLYGPMEDRAKEVLGRVEFAVQDLVLLVDNIIDLRKIEEGRVAYQMAKLDFVKVARNASDELSHIATGKGLNLSFEGPSKEIIIIGDEQKLRHAIQNLIDNAVKYTDQGFIRVSVMEKKDNVLLSVADSGIGIPKDILVPIFDEFRRDERVMSIIHGNGIGLSIVKSFIEAHGGKAWAESPGEGKGATFYISIPKESS